MSFYSDVSDDDEDDEREGSDSDGNDDPENEDVAKFLGVTKSSPDVQKAFKSLGLSASKTTTPTYRLTTHTNVTTTTTPSPLKSVLRRESGKKFSNKISHVNGTTPKVRLTYDSGWLVDLVNSKITFVVLSYLDSPLPYCHLFSKTLVSLHLHQWLCMREETICLRSCNHRWT